MRRCAEAQQRLINISFISPPPTMTRLSDISQLGSSFPRTAIALTSPFSLMVLRSFSPFLLISLGLGLFNPLCGLAIPPRNQQTAPATNNRSIAVIYVSSTWEMMGTRDATIPVQNNYKSRKYGALKYGNYFSAGNL